MKIYRLFLDKLEKLLFAVASVTLVAMAGVLVFQVLLRYIFNNPTSWSEEFATLCFVWCVMLAIPLGIRHQEHIAMSFLVNKLNGGAWRAAQIAINVVVGATLVAIGIAAFGLMNSGMHQLLPGLSSGWGVDVPLVVMYVAVPAGCLASGLYAVEQILLIAKGEVPGAGSAPDAPVEGTVV